MSERNEFLENLEKNLFESKRYAILKDKEVIICYPSEADKFYLSKERMVKKEKIGNILISTVFLVMNHNFFDGDPIWFETMIFKGRSNADWQRRYSTYEQAEEGHNRIKRQIEKWLRHKGKRTTLRKLGFEPPWRENI